MGIEASLPLTVDAMTRGQIARRRKLLDAVVQLVAEVGPERVQMRDVAERSGVALGTAYRYFSSKDHLLAAAMSDWQERLAERVLAESAGRAPRPVDTDWLAIWSGCCGTSAASSPVFSASGRSPS